MNPNRKLKAFTAPEPEDDYDRQLLSNIEQFGWHIVHVGEDETGPPFAYSIGFYHKLSHPEILVVGLSPTIASNLLFTCGTQISGSKQTFAPHIPYSDIIESFPVAFAPVSFVHYPDYLVYANWYYRNLLPDPYPALQLVLPDKGGLFPWDQNYDRRFLKLQPLLYDTDR